MFFSVVLRSPHNYRYVFCYKHKILNFIAASLLTGARRTFNISPVQRESAALREYIDTGNRLKNSASSGMEVIESGITDFVNAVKLGSGTPAVFAYLDGSSGLGKTQLAFSLHRKVLYIPWGESLVDQ
jgi:hypothetical protein